MDTMSNERLYFFLRNAAPPHTNQITQAYHLKMFSNMHLWPLIHIVKLLQARQSVEARNAYAASHQPCEKDIDEN